MTLMLDLLCGMSWSSVYVVAVFLGFKNRAWYIPRLSICMNFSWEFWAVANRIIEGDVNSVPFMIQFSWLILDIGVLLTWLLFDTQKKSWQKGLAFVVTIAVVGFASFVKSWWLFSVFFINVLMSVEFIYMQVQHPDYRHSIIIAIGKLIGTLAATILNGVVIWNPMVLWLGGISFFLDIYYMLLICSKQNLSKKHREVH